MRMRHIVICVLPRSAIFVHIIKRTTIFEKKVYWSQNGCFDFLCHYCVKHFSFYEELKDNGSKFHIGLHVMCRCSCPIGMKLEFSRQSFENYSNIIFHENPSKGSRVAPCGQTGVQTERDITKLKVAFRNFTKAPKNPNGTKLWDLL